MMAVGAHGHPTSLETSPPERPAPGRLPPGPRTPPLGPDSLRSVVWLSVPSLPHPGRRALCTPLRRAQTSAWAHSPGPGKFSALKNTSWNY